MLKYKIKIKLTKNHSTFQQL